MNAGIYKIIWSDSNGAPVVVPEFAGSHGKRSSKTAKTVAGFLSAISISVAHAVEPLPDALPVLNAVVSGATVNAAVGSMLTVEQTLPKAIINWNSFDIGSAAHVHFQQNPTDIALNRVVGANPSQIMGQLTSGGQVVLINPNGVIFGLNSRVDVGSIIASTLNITDDNFNNGVLSFFHEVTGTGSYQFKQGSYVINEGEITAANGGYIALLAPEVRNQGILTANLGTVAMAAGNAVTLTLGEGGLVSMQVQPSEIDVLVENTHMIVTEDGQVLMSAAALNRLQGDLIPGGPEGVPQMVSKDGNVRIVNVQGSIKAKSVTIEASAENGETYVAGNIDNLPSGDFAGVSGVNAVNIASNDLVFGALSVSGDLTANSNGGDITQVAALDVSGAAKFDARGGDEQESGDITLNNAGNFLTGDVKLYGNDVSLINSADLRVAEVAADGEVNLTALNGDLTLAGSVTTQGGDVTLTAQAGGVTFENSNEVYSSITSNDGDVSINAANNVQLGDIQTGTGNLGINSTLGNVTQLGALTIGGDTEIDAGGDITLNNANDFTGTVSLAAAGETGISVVDINSIVLGEVSTSETGGLTVYAEAGSITQSASGEIEVGGDTVLYAEGAVDLSSQGNDFNTVDVTAKGDVTLTDENGITVKAQLAYNALTLNANAEGESAEEVVLDSLTAIGDLTVNSNGGDITQVAALDVSGTATFDARVNQYLSGRSLSPDEENGEERESGNIALNNVGNFLTGDVSLFGNNVGLVNSNELNLKGVEATGIVSVSTMEGNLNVLGDVNTSSDEENAVTLAAGVLGATYRRYIDEANVNDLNLEDIQGYKAGDVIFLNESRINVGENGFWRIYSDSPLTAGHGLLPWITNSSKRYNVAFGEDPLAEDGVNRLYYRLQPVLKAKATAEDTVYGNNVDMSYEIASGYLENDANLDEVDGNVLFNLTGERSTSGHFTVGSHNVEYGAESGLESKMGYWVEIAEKPETVKITPREISISDVLAESRYYDGTDVATFQKDENGNFIGALHGLLSGHDEEPLTDKVDIAGLTGFFDSKNATGTFANNGSNPKRFVAALDVTLGGDDAKNYVVTGYGTEPPRQPELEQHSEPAHGSGSGYGHEHQYYDEHEHEHHSQHEYEHENHDKYEAPYDVTNLEAGLIEAEIWKAPLIITANNDRRTYNGTAYNGMPKGVRYNGFVNNENEAMLLDNSEMWGELINTGPSNGSVNAGTYRITPEGYDALNYEITYVSGQLITDPLPYVPPPIPPNIVVIEPNQAVVNVDSSLISSSYPPPLNTTMSGGFTAVESLGTVTIPNGTGLEFVVPKSTFKHSNPNAKLTYEATLEDGSPLPEWLSFDPDTQTFKGTPPSGEKGNINVVVKARDENNDEATATLSINY